MSIHETLVFQVTNPSSPTGFVLFFLSPSSLPPSLFSLQHSQSRARVFVPTNVHRVCPRLCSFAPRKLVEPDAAVQSRQVADGLVVTFCYGLSCLPRDYPSLRPSPSFPFPVRLTKLRLRRPNQRGNHVNCNYRVATPSCSRSFGKLILDNFVLDRGQRSLLFVANRIEIFV